MGFVIRDLIGSILYFPIWWYSRGAWRILEAIGTQIRSLSRTLHLPTLFRYLLKPMYGYTDIISRIISFYVRIVQFVVLVTFTTLVVAVLLIAFVAWIITPIFVVYNMSFHLGFTSFNLYDMLLWNAGIQI